MIETDACLTRVHAYAVESIIYIFTVTSFFYQEQQILFLLMYMHFTSMVIYNVVTSGKYPDYTSVIIFFLCTITNV